jgi:hypothetical protein
MRKLIFSAAIIGFMLGSCGTSKESANIMSDTSGMAKGPDSDRALFMRNPQNAGQPEPNTTPHLQLDNKTITSNKAGRR